jgi:hypothetical protein
MEIQSFAIDSSNVKYYNCKDIYNHHPTLFHLCSSKPKRIIEKRNIPEDQYTFATFSKKDGWNINECYKSQLLIKEEWANIHLFGFPQSEKQPEILQSETIIIKKKSKNQSTLAIEPEAKELPDLRFKEEKELPSELQLDEKEKFRDIDNNVLEIETRGEKKIDKILFRVDCVEKFFSPNLGMMLIDPRSKFIEHIDYKTFVRVLPGNPRQSGNKQKTKIERYLTFEGFIRAIYSTQSVKGGRRNADHFKKC